MSKSNVQIANKNLYETALILLLANMIWMYYDFYPFQIFAGVGLVVASLLVPKVFYPLAWLLIFVGKILSKFVPLVFLSVVFYLIVTPVGMFRRLIGRDSLKLKEFKKGTCSVLIDRNNTFDADDILYPY